jgi:nitrite reductase (NADH) small subunit
MTVTAHPAETIEHPAGTGWRPACPAAALQPERGVAVLLPDGRQAALFRTYCGELFAVGNTDPFSGAAVLSRGIVGDRGGEPTVASPMYKQVFSLRTGACLDAAEVTVPVLPVRERDGWIEVGAP